MAEKEYQAQWYIKNKERHKKNVRIRNNQMRVDNYLFIKTLKESTPCKDCGKFYPAYIMDFDHLRDKKDSIAHFLTYSRKALLKEIEKCEIVCSNCHRERTHQRGDVIQLDE